MERKWLSQEEAAEYVGVVRTTIYRWVKEGKLNQYKVGKVARINKEELDQLFKEGKRD